MFMDPSAFEAEDIERELTDAGLGPETTGITTTRSGQPFPNVSGDGPLKSGSYDSGPTIVPRAMVADGRQHAPTYGRHSNKVAGSRYSKPRPQMAPPSSTPPRRSLPENVLGGGQAWNGEGKFSEDSGGVEETGSSGTHGSGGGASSRARVLAQQREIERKRRQQALSAGGIRASDAVSLSRGVASPPSSAGAVPNHRRGVSGGLTAGRGTGGGSGASGGGDSDGGGDVEDGGHGFSPSVKQFSAPRQVEGDGYTTFNPNLKNGKERTSSLSEFDRRRSAGAIDILGDSDSDSDGARRRRRETAPPLDVGARALENDSSKADTAALTPTNNQIVEDKNRGRNGGVVKTGRPPDWDDRHRPSSKAYKWGQDRDDGGSGEASEGSGWRSVGRDRPPSENESDAGAQPASRQMEKSKSKSIKSRSKLRREYSDDEDDEAEESEERSSESGRDRSLDRSEYRPSSGSPFHRNGGTSRSSKHKRVHNPKRNGRRRGSREDRDHQGESASDSDYHRGKNRRSLHRGHDDDFQGDDDRSNRRSRRASGSHRTRRHRRDDRHESSSSSGSSRSRNQSSSSKNSSHSSSRRRSPRRNRSDNHRTDHDSDRHESGRRGRWSQQNNTTSRARAAGGKDVRGRNPEGGSGGEHDNEARDIGRRDGQRSRRGEGGRSGEADKEQDSVDERGRDARDRDANEPWLGYSTPEAVASGAGGGGRDGTGDGGGTDSQDGFSGRGGANVGNGGNSAGDVDELEFNMDAIDLSDMKTFLMSPCPKAAGVVQCYIRRNKSRSNKLFPEYTLFMKEEDRFLMCSKKRPNNATSNYLVSMRAGDLDRNSTNFLGKLRANFVGTEFQVFDDGFNPREPGTFGLSKTLGGGSGSGSGTGGFGSDVKRPMREELGCVLYASNVLGSRGPRKMQVAIPAVSEDGVVTKWSELDGGSTSHHSSSGSSNSSKAIERVKNRDYDGSLYMVNKPPRWNDQVGAYVLNFYGRVTMASVKNFQLVSTEDFDRIILQFGRVAKDEFTMDFQYPISPFQAFAITLSSFDSKIACD